MTTAEMRAAYNALPSHIKKKMAEMRAFKGFAAAAKLAYDPGSERNEDPPLPDISCRFGGMPRFYELGEITDEELAQDLSLAAKTQTDSGGWFDEHDPLIRILRKKASSLYQTGRVPVELILHYDRQYPFMPVEQLQNHEADIVSALIPNGPFSKVWIYDGWNMKVLWSRS